LVCAPSILSEQTFRDVTSPLQSRVLQKGRVGEKARDRNPGHCAQSRTKIVLEPRQQKLRDAGVDLAHEGTDAYGADDDPSIRDKVRNKRHRRRSAALQHGVAQGADRRGARQHCLRLQCAARRTCGAMRNCADQVSERQRERQGRR
jgi:hypothetical protein